MHAFDLVMCSGALSTSHSTPDGGHAGGFVPRAKSALQGKSDVDHRHFAHLFGLLSNPSVRCQDK